MAKLEDQEPRRNKIQALGVIHAESIPTLSGDALKEAIGRIREEADKLGFTSLTMNGIEDNIYSFTATFPLQNPIETQQYEQLRDIIEKVLPLNSSFKLEVKNVESVNLDEGPFELLRNNEIVAKSESFYSKPWKGEGYPREVILECRVVCAGWITSVVVEVLSKTETSIRFKTLRSVYEIRKAEVSND